MLDSTQIPNPTHGCTCYLPVCESDMMWLMDKCTTSSVLLSLTYYLLYSPTI